jgi:protein-tyrosine phosphatase
MDNTINHPNRVIAISGTHNFRDLGGYPCADGRQTRWRTVFRCAHLANVDDAGWKQLSSLDIRWLIDLREQAECNAAPTQWRTPFIPETISVPRSAGGYDNRQMLALEAGMDLAQARDRRVKAYCDKVLGFRHAVAAMFQTLAGNPLGSLAFHCMAGKDRTGFLAAVLLTWLGVSREYVVEDYLLTRDTARNSVPIDQANGLLALYGLENAGADALRAMTEVIPECIIAALDDIEANHGGIDRYVETASGLNSQQLDAVRERLLETVNE